MAPTLKGRRMVQVGQATTRPNVFCAKVAGRVWTARQRRSCAHPGAIGWWRSGPEADPAERPLTHEHQHHRAGTGAHAGPDEHASARTDVRATAKQRHRRDPNALTRQGNHDDQGPVRVLQPSSNVEKLRTPAAERYVTSKVPTAAPAAHPSAASPQGPPGHGKQT